MTRASSPLTRGTTTAFAVLSGLALAGCTASGGGSADVTSPTGPTPSTPEQFWSGLAMVRVTEVDPATSIDELSDRAELIVRGAAGEVDAPGDGRTRITVDASETLAGEGRSASSSTCSASPTRAPTTARRARSCSGS